MAAIDYAFTELNTAFVANNAAYTDVTGATIASGSFTAGKKYLILINAFTSLAITGNNTNLRVVHGSTAFAQSEQLWQVQTANNEVINYQWFTVWTAVGGEGITLQHQSGGTQTVNFVAMLALNLTDSLTENTDWFYNERTNDDALSTTPTDGASITFTPGIASQDWLVLTNAQYNVGDVTNAMITALLRSGEASSSTPSTNLFSGSATQQLLQGLSRVYTLGASSNTFKEQSAASGGTAHVRLNSVVFALNLHKFSAHQFIYTDADTAALSATDFATEIQTTTVTPAVTTTMFIGSTFTFNQNNYNRRVKFRNQTYVDGGSQADQPAGQTTAAYTVCTAHISSAHEQPEMTLTAMAQTGGSTYRTDIDASVENVTGSPTAKHRSLWMFSAELASSGPGAGADSGAVQASEVAQPILVGVSAEEAG